MALLPLASFAATYTNVDISTADVVITLQTSSPVYNNAVQTPTITKVEVNGVEYTSELTQFFTPKYYKKNALNNWIPQNADQIQDAGEYAVAIVANGAIDAERELQYTADKESDIADRAFYTIQKKDLNVTLANGTKQYGGADPTKLVVTPTNLPDGWTAPEFTWTGTLPIEGAHANVNADGYSYNFPLNTLTGQTYVSSVNYNVFITNQPKLIVTKKQIALNYIGTAAPVKTYGVGNTTATLGLNEDFLTAILNKANYEEPGTSELVGSDDLTDVLAGLTAAKVVVSLDWAAPAGVESANAYNDATPIVGGAEHKVKFAIDESVATNYKFTVADVALTVKQAELSAAANAPFTFAKAETAPFTYSAADQKLTKTITYTANDTKLLDETADPAVTPQVAVTYKYKALGTEGDATTAVSSDGEFTDAGVYEAYVAPVAADGNFYIDGVDPIRVTALDYTINKKDLYLYVTENAITKTYQGSPYTLPTYTGITFQGLIASDATTLSTDVEAVKAVVEGTTDETVTNAETYSIIPSLETTNKLNDNYAVQTYATTFTVSPLAITIDPKDMLNVAYGTAIAGIFAATVDATTPSVVVGNVTVTKNTTTDPDIVPADLTKVLQAYNVVVADQTYAAGQPYDNAITLEKKTLVPATTTDQNDQAIIDMLKNFTINDEGTGDVTIAKGTYQIVVKTKNKTYGENYDWTLFDDYLTPGLTGNTKPASVKFIIVNKADATDIYSQNAGNPLPKNAGTYIVSVDAANSSLAILNYDAPTLVAGELTIAAKEVTIVPDQVTVNAGATVGALNTLGMSKVTFDGKLEGDEIAYKLAFNTSGTGSVEVDGSGNLNSAANATPYAAGYKIVALSDEEIAAAEADGIEFANANYVFTFGANVKVATVALANATGALKVDAANVLIISDDADVLNRIQIAANNCDPDNTATWYDVKLDSRSLNADKWNVLVLPFDVTPYEFTQALGRYAVFNTLESVNTTNNTVSFKLQLNQLKANEPFLVKPEKLSTDVANASGNYPVVLDETHPFATRLVKYPTDGVPAKTDVTGVAFKGAYKSFDLDLGAVGEEEIISGVTYVNDGGEAGKKISYLAGGKFVTATTTDKTKSLKTLPVAFTRAYLDFNGSTLSNARILVEEADGTITAISEINAERVAANAEGWYTINGIKLQSAPVEKGVYINNGKKVVIK